MNEEIVYKYLDDSIRARREQILKETLSSSQINNEELNFLDLNMYEKKESLRNSINKIIYTSKIDKSVILTKYQIEILDLLKELNKKRGTTIVMVLHDINLSTKYADYLFAMKDGKLIKQGTPSEIITDDTIKEIYGIDSVIIPDPISNSPLVIPVSAHDNYSSYVSRK